MVYRAPVMIDRGEPRETALTLYRMFKEEVYRRRDRMMHWTALGTGSLFTLLLIILLAPSARRLTAPDRLLLAGGSLILAVTFALLIWQQQTRHRQAKQQLIALEQILGLFEGLPSQENRPIYPENWQTEWIRDHSLRQYLSILALLTGLVLTAILLTAE